MNENGDILTNGTMKKIQIINVIVDADFTDMNTTNTMTNFTFFARIVVMLEKCFQVHTELLF